MAESHVKKDGLIYSEDLTVVRGIDSSSQEFTGKIPYGPLEISEDAFSGSNIKSISIPDSVKELPPCLFENLYDLESVKLPAQIKELPPYLFSGCKNLDKVEMPERLTNFAEGLFYGCSSLKEIPFRIGLQEIGESACAACSSVTSIALPSSVTRIKTGAFAACKSLQAIVLSSKLYELADDAFADCDNIRSVRIDADNHLFYVSEKDGCLYEKSLEGQDKLKIKIVKSENIDLMDQDFDENAENQDDLDFVINEEFEEDDTFSSEIQVNPEESDIIEENTELQNDNIDKKREDVSMEENSVDEMFNDIMSDQKERETVTDDVGLSDKESQVLSETMQVMSDSPVASGAGAVSQDELEKLFASHEAEATKDNKTEEDPNAIDSKTQILLDSVEISKIIECNPSGPSPDDADLFVIAEKTIKDENGNDTFSPKLLACAQKIARIQDLKRIFMISGLPLDNAEFMQFYFHFINKRNVVLATSAASPSELSDYCKEICEQSRISLSKEDLKDQRQSVGIKNNYLIKLVVKDIY
ncbi:MAG: leucine-rich repeat protein [Treponema sp.]|nr:leucine-rich repeat protein [Treponema sp.]